MFRHRRTVWAIGLGLALAAGCFSGYSAAETVRLEGAIRGDLTFVMTLTREGDRVEGTYYYQKYRREIPVRGTWKGAVLALEETDAQGVVAGRFEGREDASGRVKGTWRRADGSKSFPFEAEPAAPKTSPADPSGWGGRWRRTAGGEWDAADLEIRSAPDGQLDFTITAFSGAHTGEVAGKARVEAGQAVFKDPGSGCRIVFSRVGGDLRVAAEEACSSFAGMGVVFDGVYRQGSDPSPKATLLDRGVLATPAQDKAFRSLVGKHYALFVSCLHLVGDGEDLDKLGATVKQGFVRGLAGTMTAIVMVGPTGTIWAAAADQDAEAVRVFTNDPRPGAEMPKTIREWLGSVAFKRVIR